MQIKTKKLLKSKVEMIIEISADKLDDFLKKSEDDLYRNFETSGFRKGKAPRDIFKREVGEKKIYQQGAQLAIETTMPAILEKEKIEVIGLPKIEIIKLSAGNPFIYKMTFSVLPKINVCDFKKIEVERKKTIIEDKEVESLIENLRTRKRKEVSVDKKAVKGNKIEMDFELFFGDTPIENGQAKKVPYVLGEKSWLPDLEKHLTGVQRGEKKEFSLIYPENYFDKKLAGREVNFKVKINEVFEIEMPEVNDQFAQELGQFKNLNDLKEKLKSNLFQEKKYKNEEKLELEILNQLVEKSKFEEVPEMLIEQEISKMIDELESSIVEQNLKFEDYLSHLKKTEEDLKKEFQPQAEKRIRTILLLRNVVQKNKISVSEKEINEELKKIKEYYSQDPSLQQKLEISEYKHRLEDIILNRKTVEFIKSKIKISE